MSGKPLKEIIGFYKFNDVIPEDFRRPNSFVFVRINETLAEMYITAQNGDLVTLAQAGSISREEYNLAIASLHAETDLAVSQVQALAAELRGLLEDYEPPFSYTQSSASTQWDVMHNYEYRPNVFVTDMNGNVVVVGITHLPNRVVISTFRPMTGIVNLS